MAIQIIVAEDHEFLRNGMKDILEHIDADFKVIGLAANGKEAVELALAEKPDVIIMDIDMPVMNGIEATKKIVESLSKIGIVGFSMSAERWKVEDMVKAGAKGYLLKAADKDEIREAIKAAANGERFFCKEVQHYV